MGFEHLAVKFEFFRELRSVKQEHEWNGSVHWEILNHVFLGILDIGLDFKQVGFNCGYELGFSVT